MRTGWRSLVALGFAVVGSLVGCAAEDESPGYGLGGRDQAGAPGPGRVGAPAPDRGLQPWHSAYPEAVATALIAPQGLAVDGKRIYWTDVFDLAGSSSTVMVLAKAGGNPVPVAVDDQHAERVAVDDVAVYWTDVAAGAVMRAEKLGGPTKVLIDGLAGPAHLALDEGSVFVTNFYDGTIIAVAKAEGASMLLAQAERPGPIVTRGDQVIWVDRKGGVISRVSGGGAPEKIISKQSIAANLAVDDDHVYWTDDLARRVMRVPVAGGDAEVVAEGQYLPRGIAVDDDHVYWVTQGDGAVRAWAKTGGEPMTLATGQLAPTEIVADHSSLYWIDAGNGTIQRLTR